MFMLEGNKNKKLYKIATRNQILDKLAKNCFDYKLVASNAKKTETYETNNI